MSSQSQADTEDGDSDLECDFYIPNAKPPVGPIRNFSHPVRTFFAYICPVYLISPGISLLRGYYEKKPLPKLYCPPYKCDICTIQHHDLMSQS
jgi:hypothetical protein